MSAITILILKKDAMMHKPYTSFTTIIDYGTKPEEICTYSSVPESQWHIALRDGSASIDDNRDRGIIKHTNYQFATAYLFNRKTTQECYPMHVKDRPNTPESSKEVSPELPLAFNELSNNPPEDSDAHLDNIPNVRQDFVGNVTNLRDITAGELFAIWMHREIYNYYKSNPAHRRSTSITTAMIQCTLRRMPNSLLTYSTYQLIAYKFPMVESHIIDPKQAKIMTGAEFNHLYLRKNKFIRHLTQDMIHNGFQWQIDKENVCPEFCPITKCGYGLYFISKTAKQHWLNYNDKIMHYSVRVRVPEHATVKIENGKFAASSLYIYKLREIIRITTK